MAADIVYKTVAFPDGYVNVAYEAGIAETGAVTAITAGALATGALPAGLVVNATDHVRITGIPTQAGTFTFTLNLTDTAGVATSGTYTITIHNQPSPGIIRNAPLTTQLKVQWPTEF
jgi:hypothetical protein